MTRVGPTLRSVQADYVGLTDLIVIVILKEFKIVKPKSKVQGPKVRTRRAWADTNITWPSPTALAADKTHNLAYIWLGQRYPRWANATSG